MTFEDFYSKLCKVEHCNFDLFKDRLQQAYAAGVDSKRTVKHVNTSHNLQPINVIDRRGNKVFFASVKEAAAWCGCEKQAIFRSLYHDRWTNNGYKFERLTKIKKQKRK